MQNLRQQPRYLFAASALSLIALIVSACDQGAPLSTLRDAGDQEVQYTGHIRLSLAHPYDVQKEDFDLLMSVPFDVKTMAVCHITAGATCEPGSSSYFRTDLIYATSTRRFFKTPSSALLENGLTLQFMSLDSSNQVVDKRRVVFRRKNPNASSSAGAAANVGAGTSSGGTVGGQTATGPVTDSQIQSVVQQYCASSCHPTHTAYGSNPASLKSTNAASRVQAGSMPPGGTMPSDAKNLLLRYLSGT